MIYFAAEENERDARLIKRATPLLAGPIDPAWPEHSAPLTRFHDHRVTQPKRNATVNHSGRCVLHRRVNLRFVGLEARQTRGERSGEGDSVDSSSSNTLRQITVQYSLSLPLPSLLVSRLRAFPPSRFPQFLLSFLRSFLPISSHFLSRPRHLRLRQLLRLCLNLVSALLSSGFRGCF